MDIKEIEKEWSKRQKEDLTYVKDFWDLRADEFNQMIQEGHSLNLPFIEKLHLKSFKILDIGCGTGRHSLSFAQRGAEVVGIDISSKMIEHAKENAKKRGLEKITFETSCWEEIDLKERNWEKNFDLVFASMSPAISTYDSLIKMMKASKKYCFYCSYVKRNDKIREELLQLLKLKENTRKKESNFYYIFNILWQMGVFPQIEYKDMKREKRFEIDYGTKIYKYMLKITDFEKERILEEYMERNNRNGEVQDFIDAKIGYMLWDVAEYDK